MITRRRALVAIGGVLLTRPATGWAQSAASVRRVAWFGLGPLDAPSPYLEALRAELRDLGWVEGRNLTISRFTSTRAPEDFETIVRDIVAAKPDVVVTQEFTTLAMLRNHATLPVVFGFSGDPVQANLVQSLARPGTNYTGMSYLASDLVGKRIEFLKEALPHVRRIAILARPQHPGEHRERAASEEAAQKLGITVAYFPIREVAEIDKAFVAIRQERCDAVVIFPDYTMYLNRERLARLAAEAKLPSISGWPSFAESGLLFNYGPNLRDLYRGLARYVNRILRGAKPEDLPVELPRTVELVVNMATAQALGIKIPQGILLRADRVIE
jgi:putative tryptophan/tyrosine transport system substrate-binding protein